jgi:hypothetical protein
MSIASVAALDAWIRGDFKKHNTELEEMYFRLQDRAAIEHIGDDVKTRLRDQGTSLIRDVLAEPALFEDEDRNYDLLGNVGLYMAALRRHELTNPEREARSPFPDASALATRIAAGLGVAPRFATAHLNLRNLARAGEYKSFTLLEDEYLFIEYNCLSIFSYVRAADALRRVPPLGVSHPVTLVLLQSAEAALQEVVKYNRELNARLDVDRFFFNVRPYFKPYRVGRNEWRGANAGDFAAINEIDLLLGLCRVSDPTYASLLIEKMVFMPREDQEMLRVSSRQQSLLDAFLGAAAECHGHARFCDNAAAFLQVCAVHGQTAAQHHDELVTRFIQNPSMALDKKYLRQITASGPPLEVLLAALEELRDKRLAADRKDIDSRHDDLLRLRAAITGRRRP